MLDENEYRLVTSKYAEKGSGSKAEIAERFYGPVLREYERITGFHETNPNWSVIIVCRCTDRRAPNAQNP